MNFRRLWCSILGHPRMHLRHEADFCTRTVFLWTYCSCQKSFTIDASGMGAVPKEPALNLTRKP